LNTHNIIGNIHTAKDCQPVNHEHSGWKETSFQTMLQTKWRIVTYSWKINFLTDHLYIWRSFFLIISALVSLTFSKFKYISVCDPAAFVVFSVSRIYSTDDQVLFW